MFTTLTASLAALMMMGQLNLPTARPSQPSTPTRPGPVLQPRFPVKTGPAVGAQTAPAASTAIAPPDQQIAQARQMADLYKRAQDALQTLQNTSQQVKAKPGIAIAQRAQLDGAIQNALSSLQQIRSAVPYDDLQRQLQQLSGNTKLTASALQPLSSAVQANKIYLHPQLVQNVQEAQRSVQAGDDQRASLDLKTASNNLYDDVALRPIDRAISDLTAAQSALKSNDQNQVNAKLQDAASQAYQLKLEAPTVPVKFELRAAADAANRHDHRTAQRLVQDAGDQLKSLRGSITAWQLRAQLDPVIQKVANLRSQLDSGKTPSGNAIADVAQQASSFRYNQGYQKK